MCITVSLWILLHVTSTYTVFVGREQWITVHPNTVGAQLHRHRWSQFWVGAWLVCTASSSWAKQEFVIRWCILYKAWPNQAWVLVANTRYVVIKLSPPEGHDLGSVGWVLTKCVCYYDLSTLQLYLNRIPDLLMITEYLLIDKLKENVDVFKSMHSRFYWELNGNTCTFIYIMHTAMTNT